MKDKKIDWLIKDAHSESQGIPFKEEYWADMSKLLDASLPLSQKSTKVNNKKSIMLGLSIVLFIGSGLFLFFKNNPDLVSENIRPIDIQNSNNISTKESTIVANNSNKSYSKTTQLSFTKSQLQTNSNILNDDEDVNDDVKIQNENIKPIEKKTTTNRITPIEASIDLINAKFMFGLYVPDLSDVNFNLKNKMMFNSKQQGIEFNDSNLASSSLLDSSNNNLTNSAPVNQLISKPYKTIKHLAFSPFIGILGNTENQQFVSGNNILKIAPQNQLSFGANLQLETKRLALRIGLCFNKFDMISINNVYQDNYNYDTSYTLVNPNYGITPSGKAIALIRKDIDSSYQSTEHSVNTSKNTYQYINIPLTVQYFIPYKKLNIEIEAGMNHLFMIPSNLNNLKLNYENKFEVPSYSYQFIFGSGVNYAMNTKYALGCRYNYAFTPNHDNVLLPTNKHQFFISLTRVLW